MRWVHLKKYQIAILAVCAVSALLSLISNLPAGYLTSAAIAVVLVLIWRKKDTPQPTATVPPFTQTMPTPDPVCLDKSQPVYNVVDLETPNQRNNRISSVSITKVCGRDILGTNSYFVNPETPFSSVNSSITGITAEMVRGAPTFPQIWGSIGKSLQDSIFVAHNASFDLSVFFKCLRDYNLGCVPIRYIDTMEIARETLPELGHYGLDDICAALDIQLDHHRADSDSRACACILIHCMDKGMDVNRYIHTFDFDRIGQSGKADTDIGSGFTTHAKKRSKATKQINDLLSLVEDICEDGKVTENEIVELQDWVNAHPELAKEFPYALIYSSIEEALRDGVLEPQELQQLFKTFRFLLDPISYTAPCGDIDLSGKMVCLTGDFDYGTKDDMESFLNGLGAVVHPRVTAKVDFLIVGNQASDEWSAGRYGNKIKYAIQLQMKGKPVKIIKESDLIDALQSGT